MLRRVFTQILCRNAYLLEAGARFSHESIDENIYRLPARLYKRFWLSRRSILD